jgi:uncharacterized membrane protein required for colicin V production
MSDYERRERRWRVASIVAIPVSMAPLGVVIVLLGMGELLRVLGIIIGAVLGVALVLVTARAAR